MRYLSRITAAFALSTIALGAAPLAAQDPVADQGAGPATEEEKILYAVGLALSRQLGALGELSAADLAMVQSGLQDALSGVQPKVDLGEYGPKIQEYIQRRTAEISAAEKDASASFLAAEAASEGAVTLESGVIVTEIIAGRGGSPRLDDRVRVNYHGTLRDGTVFDSSVNRGQPAEFALNGVIPCWREALQQMKVGGRSRVVCPAERAYGDVGRPPAIPPGAALVFEVDLNEILAPQSILDVPDEPEAAADGA